eukprot:RCo030122
MLSIQDKSTVPAPLLLALERVRDAADIMPERQLLAQLASELGPEWRAKFQSFNLTPIASASIGQVHSAVLPDGTPVAVKVQFPGVAESIDSDVGNLGLLFNLRILPSGLFVDSILKELRAELKEECDYLVEGRKMTRYRTLVEAHPDLSGFFSVPEVVPGLSTRKVLTTTLVTGAFPLDRLADPSATATSSSLSSGPSSSAPAALPPTVTQAQRDEPGLRLLQLTLARLFA